MLTENLSTLKIHKLSQEQYDREYAAGNLEETALYLTPDNYVTKDYVDSHLSGGITRIITDTLPTEPSENVIYMIPSQKGAANNIYDEYMFFTDNEGMFVPEIIGSTAVDLTNYYTKPEIDNMTKVFVHSNTLTSDYYNKQYIDQIVVNVQNTLTEDYYTKLGVEEYVNEAIGQALEGDY